jgi:V/A-type H+-transporting ATPase subunit E
MSEKTLDQLIESLKTEGIASAEQESQKILAEARQQAQQIVQAAEEKKATLLAEAKQEAQDIVDKGEAALRQAGRDYSISVRNALLQLFQRVLEAETRREFTPDLMKTAIAKVIDNIDGAVEVTLAPEFAQELAEYLHARLQSSDEWVTIAAGNATLQGFSIAKKDQGWSYTISPEEVAAALQNYLNPNWVKIMQQEAQQ